MKRARRLGPLAIVALVIGGVAAPGPARAQVAAVTVGVVFEHLTDGTTVDCTPPTPGQTPGDTTIRFGCDVSANASGFELQNRCQEVVAVSVGPVQNSTARSGCSVSVEGGLPTVVSTATRVNDGRVVYRCSPGVGFGTASYSPAPNSAATAMSGTVALAYADGVLLVNGTMANVTTISAGVIKATGFDPCGPDNLAHPFAGTIN